MAIVTLERVPNQALSVTIAGRRFDLRIFDLGDGMAADVSVNGAVVVRGQRLVAGAPFLPYRYLEAGNLILVTDGAAPDWRQFGTTQALVSLDEAGDPLPSFVPSSSGGGSGPGPTPTPGSYLEKVRNLSDLTDVAQALVNLGVYSQNQVDELLDGFLLAVNNLSDLTDFAAARANLGVYGTAAVDLLLAARLAKASNLSDLADVVAARANLGVYSTTAVDSALATLAGNIPSKATGADLRTGTNDAKFLTPKSVTDAAAYVGLTDAATVAINLANGVNFTLLTTSGVGTARTLGAPTGGQPGKTYSIEITTDAASRTLSYNAAFKFPGGTVPTLPTTSGTRSRLQFQMNAAGTFDAVFLGDVK